MIIDTSAVVAVLRNEPEREAFMTAMVQAERLAIAAPALLELHMVVDGLGDPVLSRAVDELLRRLEVEVVAFTDEHERVARAAFRDFGRGSGSPARLNFGDCTSYATAVLADEPLLFKGDDFVHTDIRAAVSVG